MRRNILFLMFFVCGSSSLFGMLPTLNSFCDDMQVKQLCEELCVIEEPHETVESVFAPLASCYERSEIEGVKQGYVGLIMLAKECPHDYSTVKMSIRSLLGKYPWLDRLAYCCVGQDVLVYHLPPDQD